MGGGRSYSGKYGYIMRFATGINAKAFKNVQTNQKKFLLRIQIPTFSQYTFKTFPQIMFFLKNS